MRRSYLARVIFVMAVFTMTLTQAGWFGGDDAEPEEPKRRGRRGSDDEGRGRRGSDDERRGQQDTVEYDPYYEPKEPVRDYRDEYDPQTRGNGSSDERREKLREMRKNKAPKDRDEMMSKEYTQKMMRDQEVEETHTPDENLDGYLTDDDINHIWSEHMHDFVPEDMSNVIVENKSTEALFEYIGHLEPTQIKGAYYVLGGNQEKTVSCIIYDPNREIVYKRKGSAQGILIFNTTIAGEYAMIFSNMQSGQDLTVTLALHTYEDKEEIIKYDILSDGSRVQIEGPGAETNFNQEKQVLDEESKIVMLGGEENMAATDEHIQAVRSMLREIQVSTKQIQSEAKLSMLRQNGHNEDLLDNSDWNFYFMLLEVVCFILICTFQTHHIKKLLDNKLII